jgi:hypothetical protein
LESTSLQPIQSGRIWSSALMVANNELNREKHIDEE